MIRALAVAVALAGGMALAGCGTPAVGHDGGGGSGGSGALDLATPVGDLAPACTMPGRCGAGGVCCLRSFGGHESVFCSPMDCQLDHGVDTYQSPLCNTAADCYGAERQDLGTLYCCPDPMFGGAIKVCRFSTCS